MLSPILTLFFCETIVRGLKRKLYFSSLVQCSFVSHNENIMALCTRKLKKWSWQWGDILKEYSLSKYRQPRSYGLAVLALGSRWWKDCMRVWKSTSMNSYTLERESKAEKEKEKKNITVMSLRNKWNRDLAAWSQNLKKQMKKEYEIFAIKEC